MYFYEYIIYVLLNFTINVSCKNISYSIHVCLWALYGGIKIFFCLLKVHLLTVNFVFLFQNTLKLYKCCMKQRFLIMLMVSDYDIPSYSFFMQILTSVIQTHVEMERHALTHWVHTNACVHLVLKDHCVIKVSFLYATFYAI